MRWFIILMLVILPLVSAQEVYCKGGDSISLINSFIDLNNNTQVVTNTTISITHPNGSIFVNNQGMSLVNASLYSYDLICPAQLGKYFIFYTGIVNGEYTQTESYFTVNNNGSEKNSDFFMIGIILLQLVIIGYFIFMRFLAKNPYLVFACTVFASLQFVILLFMVYGIVLGGIVDVMLKINFYMISITMFGVLMWKLVETAINLLDLGKRTKDKEDGWEEEETW
jgi:hypothetical protein